MWSHLETLYFQALADRFVKTVAVLLTLKPHQRDGTHRGSTVYGSLDYKLGALQTKQDDEDTACLGCTASSSSTLFSYQLEILGV